MNRGLVRMYVKVRLGQYSVNSYCESSRTEAIESEE